MSILTFKIKTWRLYKLNSCQYNSSLANKRGGKLKERLDTEGLKVCEGLITELGILIIRNLEGVKEKFKFLLLRSNKEIQP